jgi:PmbA protein
MSSLLEQARRVAERAQALGAKEAKVVASRSRGVDVEWRDGQLERLSDTTDQSLSVSLYVDGRFSTHSTSDLRPEAVETFLTQAIDLTRYLEIDDARSLPDPIGYEGRPDIDLELFDPSYEEVTGEMRRSEVAELEALAREASQHLGDKVISVSSSIGDQSVEGARVHTNGFEGARKGTTFGASVSINLKEDDGKRPVGGGYSYRRHRSDLRHFSDVVKEAVENAEGKLGAQKINTGSYTVIVKNKSISRLLSALLSPLSGAALHNKRSLWEGKKDTQIVSPILTLKDLPHIPRGLGSAKWDGDGYVTQQRPIIEDGILKTYLIGDYYAKKMSHERGNQVSRSGSALHNFDWSYGDKDLAALLADIGEGVLIDRFLGGNSNSTTGKLSFGCGGHMIRGGQIAEPLTEVNMSGEIASLWSSLIAIGNDAYPEGSAHSPSCVFEGVQLSGV